MQAAKSDMRVAIFERYIRIGGGCTHWGTIPSKALRFAIFSTMEAMKNPLLHAAGIQVNPSMAELRASSRSIINRQEEMRQTFYARNNVPVIQGRAKFIDAHTVETPTARSIKPIILLLQQALALSSGQHRLQASTYF